jgi:hypothetical protein
MIYHPRRCVCRYNVALASSPGRAEEYIVFDAQAMDPVLVDAAHPQFTS